MAGDVLQEYAEVCADTPETDDDDLIDIFDDEFNTFSVPPTRHGLTMASMSASGKNAGDVAPALER
ncbi:MAG: hypothetical protein AAGJ73_12790 [Pseudomonadota bacterium]